MQVRVARIALLLAIGLGAAPAAASVSLKNGNFYIGYTDLIHQGGFEPKIERTYNSRSSFEGIFGFGWGNDWEVYLVPMPDRTVTVLENGGGAQNVFFPPGYGDRDVAAAIDAIVEAVHRGGSEELRKGRKQTSHSIGGEFGLSAAMLSPQGLQDYRARLAADDRLRRIDWDHCLQMGWAKPPVMAEGLELISTKFGYHVIRATRGGYQRRRDDGRLELFDARGRLVKISDRNDNWVDVGHDAAGKVTSIVDNLGRRIELRYDTFGHVIEVRGGGKRARYRYVGDALVDVIDADGKHFHYTYDRGGRFMLERIDDGDRTSQVIGYYPTARGEMVRRVRGRDGSTTLYGYRTSADGRRQTTAVEEFGPDGRRISRARYDYEDVARPDGSVYLGRLTSDVDGDRTETTYDSSGNPVRIVRGGEVTAMEYDTRGHVTLKDTPTGTTRLQYHPTLDKVTRVDQRSKQGDRAATWATYAYDERGNLIHAANHEGRSAQLTYDAGGRILTLTDEKGGVLRFKYNASSRPVEIGKDGVGTITVHYTASGDIKKVDSSGGRKISLEVTSAYQNLLDLIRPAGVTLNF